MSDRTLPDAETEREAMELFEEALELPSTERLTFITGSSSRTPKVRKRAEELLSYSQDDESAFVTGKANLDFGQEDPLPNLIGGYEVLKLLGRGGMGNVYLAQRASDDFNHLAAIKVIKRDLMADSIAMRFRRERQILAELNHANIAQLFDGGELDDGSPYIVMEYIDGQPLHQWLDEQKPDRAIALTIFDQICEAVSFAHQNLIVHRDLTPSNVLIAGDGRAKLIDFGIARPPSHDDGGTVSTTGYTPGFAAPERQSDRSVNVLSDVYSLGQLLALMTRNARDDEIEAIIAKASAQDPANRYSSVAGLRSDISAYREERPVSAYNGSAFYAVRKLASRQKLLVGATAALGTALVVALVGLIIAYRGQIEAQERAADRASETRAIASTMMFDIYDEVAGIPGTTDARVMLADTAQEYLRGLAEDPEATLAMRLDAGNGFRRLGEIVGGSQVNAAGEISGGIEYLNESRTILAQILEEYPDELRATRSLAATLTSLAKEKMLSLGDADGAFEDSSEAIELLNSAAPLASEEASALILAYRFKADAETWKQEIETSKQTIEEAFERIEDFDTDIQESIPVLRARAELTQTYAGLHALLLGEPERGIDLFKDSIALRDEVIDQSEGAPDDVYALVIGLYYLSDAQRNFGDIDGARTYAARAMRLAREQRDLNPTSATQDSLFAGILILNALIDSQSDRASAAAGNASEAIDLMRERYRQNPEVASAKMNLAVRLHQAGQIYDAAGQKARACSAMREGAGYMAEFDLEVGLPEGNRKQSFEPMQAYLASC